MIPYIDKGIRPERELRDAAMQWQSDALACVFQAMRIRGVEDPEHWQMSGRIHGSIVDCLQHPSMTDLSPPLKRHFLALNRVGNWAKHEFFRSSADVYVPDLVLCFCTPAPRRRWGGQSQTPCQRIAVAADLSWQQQIEFVCPLAEPLPQGWGPDLICLPSIEIN